MQILVLEGTRTNTDVLQAMQDAARALQASVAETDVNKVDQVVEEIQEAMGLSEELDELLSQPIGPPVDEDELNADLLEMEEELKGESVVSGQSVQNTREKDEQDEKTLQTYMSSTTTTTTTMTSLPRKREVILDNNSKSANMNVIDEEHESLDQETCAGMHRETEMNSKIERGFGELEIAMGMA